MIPSDKDNSWLYVTLAAAAMLMITMGARQAQGLFVFPISGSTGVSIVAISLAMAVGQFLWGAAAPVAGMLGDRFGAARVLFGGVLVLALGTALTPLFTTSAGLVFTIGVLTAVGSGAGSFSMLVGTVMHRLPPARRGIAAGIITAGGSFGQFVFAPIIQALISLWGWMGAMWSLSVIALVALPLVRPISGPTTGEGAVSANQAGANL
ncbi:MAG: MFS transporter, partial [Candidatus Binatota bacterium]|nr:MFS transporter [Candidatus Binatota bacterium]